METLWKSLRKGSAWTEVDHVYENIEAPKFVDFAAPDRCCPDSRSWFCARIGCDESHEEVDPDEIQKNFFLRVMAARSPNVRFHKALSRRQDPSVKCPKSAPAKSTKSRLGRLAETPTKLKNHKISTLTSSTPIKTFQNAKVPKQKEISQKNKAVAKVFNTPKKPVKELSSRTKKLESKINDAAEKLDHAEPQEFDENKENAAAESNFTGGRENRLANSCDPPLKKMAIINKSKCKSAQGAKFCAFKPTNPKPFRLRTEERGILREKNLEKERKYTTPEPFRLRTDERGILRKENLARERKADNEEKIKARILKEKREPAATGPMEGREGDCAGKSAAPPPEKEKKESSAVMSKTCSLASRKTLTVPKGPNFTRVNVPKRCVMRFDLAS